MFNLFKNKTNHQSDLQLASDLTSAFSLGFPPKSKEAIKFIEKATDRKEIADKIISLCIDINDPRAYHYIAMSYGIKGTKFRPKVIEFLNKYLQNPVFENVNRHYSTEQFYNITNKEIELGVVYENLGSAYEGEYDFENALTSYLKAYEINPYNTPIYCRLATIYSKMHNLDKSISLLKEAKRSAYYKVLKWTDVAGIKRTDNTFKTVIDDQLKNYESKKDKGYIYKPRKIKTLK